MEAKLVSYITDRSALSKPFDIVAIPKISKDQARQEAQRSRNETISILPTTNETDASLGSAVLPTITAVDTQSLYAAQLADVPELATYGEVLKSSSKSVELTESETEYVVSAIKHIFKEHIVFQVISPLFDSQSVKLKYEIWQFNVRNTIPDTILENVSMVVVPSGECGLTEDFILPAPALKAHEGGLIYVSFTRNSPEEYASGSFSNTLRFVSKEVDPETGEPQEDGYDDEYQTEDLELGAGDYITPSYATFATEWDRLRSGSTATETFALTALESLKGKCSIFSVGAWSLT